MSAHAATEHVAVYDDYDAQAGYSEYQDDAIADDYAVAEDYSAEDYPAEDDMPLDYASPQYASQDYASARTYADAAPDRYDAFDRFERDYDRRIAA